MASRKPRKKPAKNKREDAAPNFLLIDNSGGKGKSANQRKAADAAEHGAKVVALEERKQARGTGEKTAADARSEDASEQDWPDREGIRVDLMVHMRQRFGIAQEVAERAVNDVLRIG